MEALQHARHTRRKRNSAKVNLTISIAFHAVIAVAAAYWAAHEGMLGKRMRELSVMLVQREKKPEEAKKEEAKQEETKPADQPKVAQTAKVDAPVQRLAPPPAVTLPADVAPPPVAVLPSFSFSDGAVDPANGPIEHYKTQIETALRARWDRPGDVSDLSYVAEAEVSIDPAGQFTGFELKKGSGDKRWDESVKKVLAATRGLNRPPPPGFPTTFTVRFDVQEASGIAMR